MWAHRSGGSGKGTPHTCHQEDLTRHEDISQVRYYDRCNVRGIGVRGGRLGNLVYGRIGGGGTVGVWIILIPPALSSECVVGSMACMV